MPDPHLVRFGGRFARFLVFGFREAGELADLALKGQGTAGRLGEQPLEGPLALLGVLQDRFGASAIRRLVVRTVAPARISASTPACNALSAGLLLRSPSRK